MVSDGGEDVAGAALGSSRPLAAGWSALRVVAHGSVYPAGSRPGWRVTFLSGDKKVTKETPAKLRVEVGALVATQALRLACPARTWPPLTSVVASAVVPLNPNGSGISLGHPIGATGAIITTKAIYELHRTGGRYALVTMCIGGGQGIAAVFERC